MTLLLSIQKLKRIIFVRIRKTRFKVKKLVRLFVSGPYGGNEITKPYATFGPYFDFTLYSVVGVRV